MRQAEKAGNLNHFHKTRNNSELQALNNIDFKSTITLKTAEALENISWWTQRCTIAWVKAHIDIEGNEAADRAAREGAENKTNTLPMTNKNQYRRVYQRK